MRYKAARDLLAQRLKVQRRLGARRIVQNTDPVGRGLRHRNAAADFALEYSGIQLCGNLLRHFQHLPVQSEPGAELVQQDTQYPQPGIVITADALDRLLDLGNPQQAQDLRRHGDNQAVRSYICIYRQQTEGRRCINDDIVVLIFYLGQGGFEQEFPSRPVKLQLRAGQQNVGRKDVAGICPYNGLLRLRLPPEYVINGGAMLNIQPQTEPQAPLRVHIHT